MTLLGIPSFHSEVRNHKNDITDNANECNKFRRSKVSKKKLAYPLQNFF